MTLLTDTELEILAANHAVSSAQTALEQAKERRAMVYALANEHGKTSGDIARLTRSNPGQVLAALRQGHGTLRRRRARQLREVPNEAAA